MVARIAAVLLTDVLLCVLLKLLLSSPFAKSDRALPLSLAVLMSMLALVAHAGVTQAAVVFALPGYELVAAAAGGVLGVVALMIVFLPMLTSSLAAAAVDVAYDGLTSKGGVSFVPSDLSKAHTLYHTEGVDRAVGELRIVFNREPERAKPLIAAANLLWREGRHDEAVVAFREVMWRFPHDEAAWGPAACQLAQLLMEHYADTEGARHLLREVVKRMPGTGLSRRTRLQLAQPPYTSAPDFQEFAVAAGPSR